MHYFQPAKAGQTVHAVPGEGLNLPVWILGSSLFGATFAAELGLPFAFASHFAPADMMAALAIYREHFPRQEKVIRLYFGLGCQRSHSALEIAEAFEVSSQVIAGILGAAERKLARLGLTPIQMRAAARREAALHPPPGARSVPESKRKSWSGHRAHR